MVLRARIYAYNRHLSFDVAFICSTLTHCGVCDLSVWRLKWGVIYVHQRVWRWKWFSCQSSYVLQRIRLCRASDTVFRREIDSQRQWGYGTCYGDSFPRCEGVYQCTEGSDMWPFKGKKCHNYTVTYSFTTWLVSTKYRSCSISATSLCEKRRALIVWQACARTPSFSS